MRHFDVQLLGGIVLHQNSVAEMLTGEGKTLVATLPAYLNALSEKGVHIVTMNDYLSKRDAEKNRYLFEFLGLTVGNNIHGISLKEKREAYLADITYGTNHEYGFDYLRDNMIFSSINRVQRSLHYALIDEVDSILIDEARTPLIISGSFRSDSNLYKKINDLVIFFNNNISKFSKNLKNQDFYIDHKQQQVFLTELGVKKSEYLLKKNLFIKTYDSLYTPKNIIFLQHIILALKAHYMFYRDKNYIVHNSTILIVDEHSGRVMPDRRWADGLHQAIEAKENLSIKSENTTLASITFQNYFRLYEKLSGMTGTAITESCEFKSIYNLDTISIPTNKPMIRKDFPDLVFLTEKEKNKAIIKNIQDCYQKKQPVLVGTVSIEKSEILSKNLKKLNIKHNVLNAKLPSEEARIIAHAGRPGAVTIATNMAGRGTDIILGGFFFKKKENKFLPSNNKNDLMPSQKQWILDNQFVIKIGGLHIIGTEKHESRRIDDQLRGRSGRQGDPGSSIFYLSLDDDFMRFFSSKKITNIINILGSNKNFFIQNSWINYAITTVQKKIENQNFNIRKQLLEYDDIINEQRKAIYSERNKIIDSIDIHKHIIKILLDCIEVFFKKNFVYLFKKNIKILDKKFYNIFKININLFELYCKNPNFFLDIKNVIQKISELLKKKYEFFSSRIDFKYLIVIEKSVILQSLDFCWRQHLNATDYLRNTIHLRGYAQKNPKQEYEQEVFFMFQELLDSIKILTIKHICRIFFINFEYKKNIFIDLIKKNDDETFNFFVFNT